jgi:hypothetical protein
VLLHCPPGDLELVIPAPHEFDPHPISVPTAYLAGLECIRLAVFLEIGSSHGTRKVSSTTVLRLVPEEPIALLVEADGTK